MVVLAEVLRIGEDCLKELERHYLLSVVVDLVDTCHAYVLDHAQVGEVFLSECHPETSSLD